MGSLLNSFMLFRFLYQLLLVHLMVVNLCFSSQAQPLCIEHERSSLLQFKESFNLSRIASGDPSAYAKFEFWTETSDCCSWDGVQCDPSTGHVIGLELNSSLLYGSLNSDSTLFNLVNLEKLNLADNDFNRSPIPTAFSKLPRLSYLDLSFSGFSGQIPNEISRLSRLSYLDLSSSTVDTVSGQKSLLQLKNPGLKGLLMNLTSIEELHLSFVEISSTVPDMLADLSTLEVLELRGCGLNGEFPRRIFQLPKLQILSLRDNIDLHGALPPVQQSSLEILSIAQTSFFSGELPLSIENLPSLNALEAFGCNFSGEIPSSIAKLNQLSFLDLSENNFRGPIPPFLENLANLTFLSLASNQFTGRIPESFSRLTNLVTLLLHNNDLSGSVNFDMLLGLKNLSQLYLSDNNLSGVNEPSGINSSLAQFTMLGLDSCNLSKFPDFLMNQKRLESLSLRGNQIGGLIPKWIWTTSEETLLALNLANNFLTGFEQTPVVLPGVIRFLVLSFNLLKGPLPIPPFSTILFDISNNHLTGQVSPLICNLESLQVLHLSDNRLSGVLPQCLGNFGFLLSVLNLRKNSFTGTIPQSFTQGIRLRVVDLSYNQLQGQVPRSLENSMMLEKVVLSNNQLNDIFPSWLGTLPELRVLVLKSNEFYGVIDDHQTNFQFPKLHIIDLSNNNFVGKLPSKYIQSWNAMKDSTTFSPSHPTFNAHKYLLDTNFAFTVTIGSDGVHIKYEVVKEVAAQVIDLSSNKFEGEIPQLIGDLQGLNGLNLSNNILSGGIPSSFGNLTELEFLDLSHNKLSGEIPKQLTNLKFLRVFNVSHNQLTGPIPQGSQFDTFESSSYEGNSGLCGHPLPLKCGNSEGSNSGSEFEFDWKIVWIGYGCGVVVGFLIGQIVISRKYKWSAMSFRISNNSRRRKGWMRLRK